MAFRTVNTVLNARLEAAEARTDARVSDLKGEINALSEKVAGLKGGMAGMDARMDERAAHTKEEFSRIRQDLGDFKVQVTKQITNLKYIVVTTGVASVIGLYSANVATMQALLAAYDSGKAMATQFAKTADRLDRISERLDAQEQKVSQRLNSQ
jgi:phage host-nuclease inhibitor protein Gam